MRIFSTRIAPAALTLLISSSVLAQVPQQAAPQQVAPQQAAPQQAPVQQPGVQQQGAQSWGTQGTFPTYVPPVRSETKRSRGEITLFYVTGAAYGVGMGIWVSTELGIDDPGVFLIPPAILGIAAPVGVYLLDRPDMPKGLPSAISAGMAIGAGEGIGIASLQFASANEADAWGFRGLARASAIGSTLGAVGGYAYGYYLEPTPQSSAMLFSGTLWGSAIGSMFGYGGSKAGVGYGLANDSAALGGLIGYNVGLVGAGALSYLTEPTWKQISWMWAGAGIGAAVSLPVFLAYTSDDSPPAKRGLLFMGTATTLGLVAGGIFGSGGSDSAQGPRSSSYAFAETPPWASVTSVAPFVTADSAGLFVGGSIR